MGVGLAMAVAFGIVIGVLKEEGGFLLQILASILQLIATYLYTGFVVKLVQDVRDGRRDSSVGELVSSAMPALGVPDRLRDPLRDRRSASASSC